MCSGYRRTNEKVITGKGIALFTHKHSYWLQWCLSSSGVFYFILFLFYLVIIIIIIVLSLYCVLSFRLLTILLLQVKKNLYIFRILSNKIIWIYSIFNQIKALKRYMLFLQGIITMWCCDLIVCGSKMTGRFFFGSACEEGGATNAMRSASQHLFHAYRPLLNGEQGPRGRRPAAG